MKWYVYVIGAVALAYIFFPNKVRAAWATVKGKMNGG